MSDRESRTFLAIGAGCWGKGESIRTAIKVARLQGASVQTKFQVWITPATAQPDGTGYIRYGADEAPPVDVGLFSARFVAQ